MHNHHLNLRAKVIIMLSVMASLFLVALDQTIVTTALGRIVEDLHAFSSLSWIVTAYMLTTTVTVPIAGKLSDLFGRKIMLLIGVAVFGLASLMCGTSDSITTLVLWRAAQGVGAGIITANAFTIIGDLFAARERGKWQGMFGAVFGLSSIVGPLLGGWLTDHHSIFGLQTSWHWIFWINVPIALIAFALIATFCPPLRHSRNPQVDYTGGMLLTLALGTLVLAVDNTEQIFHNVLTSTGWSLLTLRAIMFGIVLAATLGFAVRQKRAPEPILPPHFFQNRNYSLIMLVATLFGAGFMGSIIYLTQFNQQVFGATPTQSGLMLLPMIAGMMVSSIGSGQLITRTGHYKKFMQTGIILTTVMIATLATLTPDTSYVQEAVQMCLLGLGLGLVLPVINIAIQNEFEQKNLGAATSSIQLFRGLGSTVGIAVFGAMLTSGLASHLGQAKDNTYLNMLARNPMASKRFQDLTDTNTMLTLNMPSVRDGIRTSALKGIESSPLPKAIKEQQKQTFIQAQDEYSSLITHAFSESIRNIFLASAALMAPATALVYATKERELKSASAHTTPGEA